MKIIVDDKIPYLRESLEKITTDTVYLPGNKFTPEAVRDADALIVRTRTRCDAKLLEGSNVRFIATATIGFDHIDTHYCHRKGIVWTNAPGSNSASVRQYVQSCLLLLEQRKGISLSGLCLGIVGVGNVGKQIKSLGESLGMKVLLNDPPRAGNGESGFTGLEEIARECDIITFHTPLSREGSYPTFHLAGEAFFASLKKRPVLINTSRGEVVETKALLHALKTGQVCEAVIDVWENEPDIDLELLKRVMIGTPHIAGYSADGKANATRMSLESLCRFFGIDCPVDVTPPAPADPVVRAETLSEAYLTIYNPETDSRALKENPGRFEWFRGNYPIRREPEAYTIRLDK